MNVDGGRDLRWKKWAERKRKQRGRRNFQLESGRRTPHDLTPCPSNTDTTCCIPRATPCRFLACCPYQCTFGLPFELQLPSVFVEHLEIYQTSSPTSSTDTTSLQFQTQFLTPSSLQSRKRHQQLLGSQRAQLSIHSGSTASRATKFTHSC